VSSLRGASGEQEKTAQQTNPNSIPPQSSELHMGVGGTRGRACDWRARRGRVVVVFETSVSKVRQ